VTAEAAEEATDEPVVPIVDLEPPTPEQRAQLARALARILVSRALADLAHRPANDATPP
jgi:hypothetical protein